MNNYITISQFFAFMDSRVALQLSGDQNTAAGNPANLQMLLDAQADELNTYLNGRFNLPIQPTTIPATGMASVVAVPPDNSTVAIGDGTNVVTFTFLSGGIAANQVNTVTGNTSDIAALWAAIINKSGLAIRSQARLYSVALVNTSVPGASPPSGYLGNVPIVSSNAAVVVVRGMIGGSTQVPPILTKLVATATRIQLFARRSDRPKQMDADEKWYNDWLQKLVSGVISIPNVNFASYPELQDSNYPQGSSAFDGIFSTPISPFGPQNPSGNVGTTNPFPIP